MLIKVLVYQQRIKLSKPVSIIFTIFLFQTIPEGFIGPTRFIKGVETVSKNQAGLTCLYIFLLIAFIIDDNNIGCSKLTYLGLEFEIDHIGGANLHLK